MCRSILPVLLWLVSAQAAVTNIQFLGSTPTQAVIAYTAPDSSACTIEVSESASYIPLVNDVNPALFPGSNLDGRPGSLGNGLARTVVIGKRASEMAADGRYYSRALQAYTPHYYRITCGSDVATDTFTTLNISLGKTYNDPFPRDPAHPGRYAWPTMDWSQPTTPGNGTLTSSGGAVTFAQNENIAVGEYIVLTSGPNAGQQMRVTAVSNSKHVTIFQTFSQDQTSPVTWAKRTPEKTSTQQIIDPFTGLLIRRISNPQESKSNSYGAALSAVTPGAGWTNASTTSLAKADSNVASYVGDANRNWLFVHTNSWQITSYQEGDTQLDWIGLQIAGSGTGSGPDNAIDLCLTADGATCRSAVLTLNLSDCTPWVSFGGKCWVGTEYPLEASWNSATDVIGSLLDPVEFYSATGGVLIRKHTTTRNTINLDYVAFNLGQSAMGESYSLGAQACSAALANQTYNGVTRIGYRCSFGTVKKGGYWIDSATGDAALSAFYVHSNGQGYGSASGASFDANDASIMYGYVNPSGTPEIVKLQYTGTNTDSGYVNVGQAAWPFFSYGTTTVLSSNIVADMAAFSPEFAATQAYWGHYPLTAGLADGRYLNVNFYPGGTQDNYGWKGMYDVKLPGFVAGTSTDSYFPSRWCQMHTGGNGSNGLGWVRHNSQGAYNNGACGNGPFQTELVAALGTPGSGTGQDVTCPAFGPTSIGRGYQGVGGSAGGVNKCAYIQVTGDLHKPTAGCGYENTNRGANGHLGAVQAARVGDLLLVDSEHVQLLAKDAGCSDPNAQCGWTILRGADSTAMAAHSPGTALTGICPSYSLAYQDVYWDFLHDPYGTDETMTYKKLLGNVHSTGMQSTDGTPNSILIALASGGTTCRNMGGDVGFCYGLFSGSMNDIMNQSMINTPARAVNMEPWFANRAGEAGGADSHGSLWQKSDYRWLLDGRPYYAPIYFQTWTNVTGKLYKASFTPVLQNTPQVLDQKHLPSEGFCASSPAIDVTPGPIDATTNGAYTYCAGAGCYAGAATTDVFMNCPDATTFSCGLGGAETGTNSLKDMCVHDLAPVGHVYEQVGITPVADRNAEYTRFFGTPFGRYRREDVYKNMTASPDGKWAFFEAHWLDGMRSENMALKLPPWPPKDSINRSTFIPVLAPVGSVPSGTDNVVVEFGYDNTNFYCTSRRESCEAVTATVNETTPFYWASESYSGFRGAPGAIAIPAISERVLYYRLKYRDAGNAVIGTGPTQVQVVR
jgi:hypothetical protein